PLRQLEAGADPMSGVGARADAMVALLHDGEDVIRVPHLVTRILRPLGMVVKTDADVVFLHELLDGVDRIDRLGGDAVEAKLFGELKNLARLRFVFWNPDHAVVHRLDAMLGQLGLYFLDDVVRGVVVPFHLGLVGTELLAGKKLDDPAAGLRGLLDGLEHAETVEGVSLAAEHKAPDLVFVGNFSGGNGRGYEHGGQNNAKIKRNGFR